MHKEIWKDIKGYEGLYQVSNLGRVKSIKDKITLKTPTLNKATGYYQIDLYKNNKRKKFTLHRLVICMFLGVHSSLKLVNHKDGVKTNNSINNLEWSNKKLNALHYWSNEDNSGFWLGKTSYKNPNSKEVKGFCLKTNKLLYVFGSASEAARNGFNQGLVSAVARGERVHHKNIIWKYA
jgi:hypothetical protein